jgi:Transcriptional Coactivator p15 (PC4)
VAGIGGGERFGGEPLTDDGLKLASINRGPNRELRVRWREFKGHQFLDIREWSVNIGNAQWFPTKGKGVTVKARELNDFATAIKRALALIQAGSRG